MNFKEFQFKVNLHKRYFDVGYGVTSYFKYLLVLFGAYSFQQNIDLKLTLIVAIAYMFFCYVFGWIWLNKGWYEAELEVTNRFNLFVKEMRKSYSVRRKV